MNTGLAPARSLEHSQPRDSSRPAAPFTSRFAHFGSFDLDLARQELFKDGERVKLQGKVGEVLLILLESPGEVVTRGALRARLWPNDAQVNYDANVNTTVNKLRQMLGDTPEQPLFVETIPRKGYSFVGKVEYADQPATRPTGTDGPEAGRHAARSSGGWFSALRSAPPRKWIATGAFVLLLAGMLFGAALVLYAHRPATVSVVTAVHPDVK
ncbi:MAG TPA: winged helix-turn-helix domain-containing protein [Candidatus Saccharimonadales bacterium]|nr:winged helix-turn-helix domain-containing protein [Candidatus Saccharimonadales bacterium]